MPTQTTKRRRGITAMNSLLQIALLLAVAVLPCISANDTVVDQVQATLDQASQLLQEPLPPVLDNDMEHLQQTFDHLQDNLFDEFKSKQAKVEELITLQNAKQLQALMGRLQAAYEQEKALRGFVASKEEETDDENTNESPEMPDDLVTLQQLEQRLDPAVIVEQSEASLLEWMQNLVREELVAYKERWLAPVAGYGNLESGGSVATSNAACPSTSDIVQHVQQALTDYANDGIGKVDLAQGANIIHFMTSETYKPPKEVTLGSVWWRKYIPMDWEDYFLPPGWEKWSVELPSYLAHSMNFVTGGIVAPPETILQKSVLPGSCWPMEGTSGKVILKLKQPTLIEEITIDHVSKAIIPEEWETSAPKTIKIVGYPPCDEDDKDCQALGFDDSQEMDIAQFTYDIEGPSVQSFRSYYGQAMKDLAATQQEQQQAESEDGSCSTEAASCTTPPRIYVAGVEVQVKDNWGQELFTCLYRVRLHGEVA